MDGAGTFYDIQECGKGIHIQITGIGLKERKVRYMSSMQGNTQEHPEHSVINDVGNRGVSYSVTYLLKLYSL